MWIALESEMLPEFPPKTDTIGAPDAQFKVVLIGPKSKIKKQKAFVFLLGVMLRAGGEVMNIQTPNPSAYAPAKVDPIRLASATIQAVDRIGAATSEEIEKTADEIMRGASEIAEKLRALAIAIREHSKIANEHVSGFCNKATSVLEGVRDLQMKLEVNGENEAAEDTSPLPSLVRKGPAEFEDSKL
jgi:hypothetical protein